MKDDGTPVTEGHFDYIPGGTRVLGALLADGEARALTQDEASAFGRLHSFCCACGRDLDDDRSLAAGYGPVCARNLGWWYPTMAEAREILNRPTEVPEPGRDRNGDLIRGNTANEIFRSIHRSDCD